MATLTELGCLYRENRARFFEETGRLSLQTGCLRVRNRQAPSDRRYQCRRVWPHHVDLYLLRATDTSVLPRCDGELAITLAEVEENEQSLAEPGFTME